MPSREQRSASLRALVSEAEFIGCDDLRISGVSRDSRLVSPGQTFIAINGPAEDGHDHVQSAIDSGAEAIIVERPLAACQIAQAVVPSTRLAYNKICFALEGHPTAALECTGVTGTNGKSTVAWILREILEANDQKSGLVGTICQKDGTTSIPSVLTTPDAATLGRLARRMVESGCRHLVMEVSSHALDQQRVSGIEFRVGVFTNLTHDHFDYHGDWTSYLAAKRRLFEGLDAESIAVVNGDDPHCDAIVEGCPARVVRVGVLGQRDYRATDLRASREGTSFRVLSSGMTRRIETSLVGRHNVLNCLLAYGAAHALGMDSDQIQHGLRAATTVPGRLERIDCQQPFDVYVDYAHTPAALDAVLAGIREITPGRVLCLFGAGGDRDNTKRPLMASAVGKNADWAVVTSDNPRTESPGKIIQQIVQGFGRSLDWSVEIDRAAAIGKIIEAARPGDAVVLCGKGHEDFQIVGRTRRPFDDRLVAEEVLGGQRANETQRLECQAWSA